MQNFFLLKIWVFNPAVVILAAVQPCWSSPSPEETYVKAALELWHLQLLVSPILHKVLFLNTTLKTEFSFQLHLSLTLNIKAERMALLS